ncbi:hypothetical protein [Sporomusa acidovorans]|uniref:Uncharacterized protein n=1 Tax=Sporomusa acidovorans (strain ATCC 49682 / DSM 3132 / Mol) TaxID=1123286 RepID=A0ABZ3J902_SPOA4|nr:hypothetical protein [Sporomusa acidovorans]OZC14434.1 hypothetical protein SPACI_52710 [Sporomusa acidovorans DSM 3132]SDF86849.1 hypothetical protein SAMN04488499_11093 [Sporomusa acidovorans]
MEITENFIKMEKEVVMKLLDGQDDRLAILRDQYLNASIKSREFSGTGFFTSFVVPSNVLRLESPKSFQLGDVIAQVIGVKDGVGFVFFIKNGTIDLLEGYVYGDEKWPHEIKEYKVSYISGVERDMEKIRTKWE